MSRRPGVLLLVMAVVCGSALVAAQDDAPIQSSLRVVPKPGQKLLEFPLKHTDVQAEIAGMVAHVTVTQEYENPFDEPIEAVYVFPLPNNAAINDMLMQIGDRTVRGIIETREKAREIYEEAVAAGQRASLLEQERPNIFTQSVGNILPDDEIKIVIKYVETLAYVDGKYEYVFPMVVGPRFIPGTRVPTPADSGGWAPNTDRVPDASRITPPVLKPDVRTGHDISVTVHLNAGVPLRKLHSESHDVKITRIGSPKATVTLKPHDTIPNKDFELEWEIAGDQPEIGLLTYHGEVGGFFLMMVAPKAEPKATEITAKEMVFVVDCSGSMRGEPTAKAKEAMRRCITGMNPDDSFQIIRFSSSASQFSPKPIPNTPENIEKGLAYIDAMEGSGGTQMIEGIKASLEFAPDPERMRIVSFMTDGKIGNETEILAAIDERLGEARLFSFGVGTSVNRYLLDRMAEVGRGVVDYVNLNEDTETIVNRFYERIRAPYLTDIEVDWGDLTAADVYPQRIPDLFSAQPVLVYGRYDKPGTGPVEVSGKIAGEPWSAEIHADFPGGESGSEALSSLWARRRIRDLMARMYRGQDQGIVDQVTAIGLEFRLMTSYTSFVAVDEEVVVEDGQRRTVHQPVPLPEGVSFEGVFGPPEEILGAIVGSEPQGEEGDYLRVSGVRHDPQGRAMVVLPASPDSPAPTGMMPGAGMSFGYAGRGGGGGGLGGGGMGPGGMMGPGMGIGAMGQGMGGAGFYGGRSYAGSGDYVAGGRNSYAPRAYMRPGVAGAMGPGMMGAGMGGVSAWWLVLIDSDAEGIRESSNAITRLTFAASGAIALPSVGAPLPTTLDSLGNLAAAAEKANRDALPAVFIGREALELTDEQRAALPAYMDAGGFLIVLSADQDFSAGVLERLSEAVPGLETSANLAALRANDDLPYQPAAPQARALTLDGELVGVVLGRSYLEAWSAAPTDDTTVAYELGVNILAHVLQSAWRTAVAAPVAEE